MIRYIFIGVNWMKLDSWIKRLHYLCSSWMINIVLSKDPKTDFIAPVPIIPFFRLNSLHLSSTNRFISLLVDSKIYLELLSVHLEGG